VHASGGLPPYGVTWSTGATGTPLSLSPMGSTTCTAVVTDALGQQTQATVDVRVASRLSIKVAAASARIMPGAATTLFATVSGGLAPYTYAWSTGEHTASITVSPTVSTTYAVGVTDALGQWAEATQSVTVNSPLAVTVTAAPRTVQAGQNSVISAIATGGVPPYTYRWDTGATGSSTTIAPEETTTCSATVTDAIGRTTTGSTDVQVTLVAAVVEENPGAAMCMASAPLPLAVLFCGWMVLSRSNRRR
jgi:hypothetical protein